MGSADGFSEYIQSNPAIESKFYRTRSATSAATLYPEVKRVLVADGRNLRTHLCDMCSFRKSFGFWWTILPLLYYVYSKNRKILVHTALHQAGADPEVGHGGWGLNFSRFFFAWKPQNRVHTKAQKNGTHFIQLARNSRFFFWKSCRGNDGGGWRLPSPPP